MFIRDYVYESFVPNTQPRKVAVYNISIEVCTTHDYDFGFGKKITEQKPSC